MKQNEVAELYERYGETIRRHSARILRSDAGGEDALNEVFLRVLKYGATYRGDAPLAWLRRIATRHCLDVLARRRPVEPLDERGPLVSEAPAPDGRRFAAQVLARCDSRAREVASLRYFEQMTQDEVAAVLGVSRTTVRKRLMRFKSQARAALSE